MRSDHLPGGLLGSAIELTVRKLTPVQLDQP